MRETLSQWWTRAPARRGRRALDLQLVYQQKKAAEIASTGRDITPHMRVRSAHVRALIERVTPLREDARVLEVGSGAHGVGFFFGLPRVFGIDPLAHHYVTLFPAWQRRVRTAAASGDALPFADAAFDVVISDNVVDHAEHPGAILREIGRVLAPLGVFYFEVNISHPVYGLASHIQGLWRAVGVPFEIADFAEHTVHLPLDGARRLFDGLPLRIAWEHHNIQETRAAVAGRKVRRLRAWIQATFYFGARYEAIAIREAEALRPPAPTTRGVPARPAVPD